MIRKRKTAPESVQLLAMKWTRLQVQMGV